MSSAATPAPKAMSSRLLTMKFMQRAAASPPTPTTPDEPSPKRRKTDTSSTPTKINVDSLADQRAVEAAMAKEEAKRQLAIDKLANEAGDTRWVLSFDDQKLVVESSFLPLRVEETGFAKLDASSSHVQYLEDGLEDKPTMIGRRSFGSFNRALEKQQNPSLEDTESEGEEAVNPEDEEDYDENDPMTALIRASRREASDRFKAERKAKHKEEKATSIQLAKERKKKEVSLNGGMTSLSGGGIKCFGCGGPHRQHECPNKRRYDGGDDGPPRKSRKSN